jgi:hypothetical protein
MKKLLLCLFVATASLNADNRPALPKNAAKTIQQKKESLTLNSKIDTLKRGSQKAADEQEVKSESKSYFTRYAPYAAFGIVLLGRIYEWVNS